MSILIKGMEMPKENAICVVIFSDGRVTSQFGVPHLGTAVPIPPHGRLIDADVLKPYMLNEHYKYRLVYDANEVANVPTIIPAEPPKEEA